FDEPIQIAVDEIVPGATGAAHRKGTDEKKNDVPRVGKVARAHACEPNRPPARDQQKPGADRSIESRQAEIWAAERRRETVDPVSGRIGDASGAIAHFPSGLPVNVSNVPRPVLMLLESGTGALSASLKLGPCGRGGAAAT